MTTQLLVLFTLFGTGLTIAIHGFFSDRREVKAMQKRMAEARQILDHLAQIKGEQQ